jgi:hypothetical protein
MVVARNVYNGGSKKREQISQILLQTKNKLKMGFKLLHSNFTVF